MAVVESSGKVVGSSSLVDCGRIRVDVCPISQLHMSLLLRRM